MTTSRKQRLNRVRANRLRRWRKQRRKVRHVTSNNILLFIDNLSVGVPLRGRERRITLRSVGRAVKRARRAHPVTE